MWSMCLLLTGARIVSVRNHYGEGTFLSGIISVSAGGKVLGLSEKEMCPKKEMCPGTGLNCRHEDFQSSALPTELPGHIKY